MPVDDHSSCPALDRPQWFISPKMKEEEAGIQPQPISLTNVDVGSRTTMDRCQSRRTRPKKSKASTRPVKHPEPAPCPQRAAFPLTSPPTLEGRERSASSSTMMIPPPGHPLPANHPICWVHIKVDAVGFDDNSIRPATTRLDDDDAIVHPVGVSVQHPSPHRRAASCRPSSSPKDPSNRTEHAAG